MSRLVNFLADVTSPEVQWLTGKVYAVNADSTVTLEYRGGFMYNVGTLDQYSPVKGDIVHALSREGQGTLILGSNNTPVTAPPESVAGIPVILTPLLARTYDLSTGSWTAGVGVQRPDVVGAWTYDAAALQTVLLETVEIEMLMTSGGPPEFVTHDNQSLTGSLVVSEYIWRSARPVPGVATWVSLPIGWGEDLISGAIAGFGLSSSGQSGAYSGTGRVRMTPLSERGI